MEQNGKGWLDRYLSIKLVVYLALMAAAIWQMRAC
jgi:hypothetical protein